MADKLKDTIPKSEGKNDKKKEGRPVEKQENVVSLIRIMSTDIPGNKKIAYGLIRIKGISYAFANALCHAIKIDPSKKVSDLSEAEIKKITEFVQDPKLPSYMLNRRKDYETGKDKHLSLTNLELQKEFDIRKLRKIRSYKGWRHALNLPVRGQRTKSHFRKNKSVGVHKKKGASSGGKKK